MRTLDHSPSPGAEGRPSKRLRLEYAQDGLDFPQVSKDLEESEYAGVYTLNMLTPKDSAFNLPLGVEEFSRTPEAFSDWDVDHNYSLHDDLDILFPTIAEPKAYRISDVYDSTTLNDVVEDLEQSREFTPPPLTSAESSLDSSPDSTLTASPNEAKILLREDVIVRPIDDLDFEEDDTPDRMTGIEDTRQSEIVCFGMVKRQYETQDSCV